jgi:hypothetical protein
MRDADPLELDTRWARKAVQEMAAELVAHHWVSSVIAHGGAMRPEEPEAVSARLTQGAKEAMQMSASLVGRHDAIALSQDGAVRLSFLKAFTPIAIEIDRYAHTINAKLEAKVADPASLQEAVSQLLMEQALWAQQQLPVEAGGTDDDRRMLLQACLQHAGAMCLSLWEPTRGDALGTLVDAPTVEAGRTLLQGPSFTHGFPVDALRDRVRDGMQRLVGTAQTSMSMLREARLTPDMRQRG